jgi:hypothetical protein
LNAGPLGGDSGSGSVYKTLCGRSSDELAHSRHGHPRGQSTPVLPSCAASVAIGCVLSAPGSCCRAHAAGNTSIPVSCRPFVPCTPVSCPGTPDRPCLSDFAPDLLSPHRLGSWFAVAGRAPRGSTPNTEIQLTARSPRRRNRSRTRSLFVLALLFSGCATASVRPELRTLLTDRWDWAAHPEVCAHGNVHSISFSPDGRRMIIRHPLGSHLDDGQLRPLATYEILESGLTARTARIPGDPRRTELGEPVVWQLVLTSRDTYCWHRTDWGPGVCTAEVVRCPSGGSPTSCCCC